MTDEDEFIASGLENYVEAITTITYFRRQVERRLRAFAEGRPESQRVKREASPVLASAAPANSLTPWFVCQCPTRVDGALATLEVGLWWITPGDAVVYASFTSGPDWLQQSLSPRTGLGFRIERSGSRRHFVCKVDGGNLESAWQRLLEEIFGAVERSEAGSTVGHTGGDRPTP